MLPVDVRSASCFEAITPSKAKVGAAPSDLKMRARACLVKWGKAKPCSTSVLRAPCYLHPFGSERTSKFPAA